MRNEQREEIINQLFAWLAVIGLFSIFTGLSYLATLGLRCLSWR